MRWQNLILSNLYDLLRKLCWGYFQAERLNLKGLQALVRNI